MHAPSAMLQPALYAVKGHLYADLHCVFPARSPLELQSSECLPADSGCHDSSTQLSSILKSLTALLTCSTGVARVAGSGLKGIDTAVAHFLGEPINKHYNDSERVPGG